MAELPSQAAESGQDPTTPKYPRIKVRLTGQDGNAFAVLGTIRAVCRRAMSRGQFSHEDWDRFREEAMSGDYDHLLRTVMQWFDVH
jgi:phytoene dehydrogenase-like protein